MIIIHGLLNINFSLTVVLMINANFSTYQNQLPTLAWVSLQRRKHQLYRKWFLTALSQDNNKTIYNDETDMGFHQVLHPNIPFWIDYVCGLCVTVYWSLRVLIRINLLFITKDLWFLSFKINIWLKLWSYKNYLWWKRTIIMNIPI